MNSYINTLRFILSFVFSGAIGLNYISSGSSADKQIFRPGKNRQSNRLWNIILVREAWIAVQFK